MSNKFFTIIFSAVLIGLCAWSPWLTRETASKLAETQFNRAWSTVIDGCGTAGNTLGTKEFRKVPFGAIVSLAYQCGLVAPNEPPLHTKVYVSFIGFASGFPRP